MKRDGISALVATLLAGVVADQGSIDRRTKKETRRARNRDRRDYDKPKKRIRTLNRYRVGLSKGRLAPPMEPKPYGPVYREGREWVAIGEEQTTWHATAREAWEAVR